MTDEIITQPYAIDGVVYAIARKDQREAYVMFDTPAQANGFVEYMRRFIEKPEVASRDAGGAAPSADSDGGAIDDPFTQARLMRWGKALQAEGNSLGDALVAFADSWSQDWAEAVAPEAKPEWPKGAFFTDGEGNFYDEQAEPLDHAFAPPAPPAPLPGKESEADMFWDHSDNEIFGHDIDEIVAEYDPGDIVKIDQAKRLPTIKVRVIAGEKEDDPCTWELVNKPRAAPPTLEAAPADYPDDEREALQELIAGFRLSNWVDEDGALPLVDRITSGGDIGPAIEQIELLADEIAAFYADRAQRSGVSADPLPDTDLQNVWRGIYKALDKHVPGWCINRAPGVTIAQALVLAVEKLASPQHQVKKGGE